jgi:uncharacterized protein with HEPN domain
VRTDTPYLSHIKDECQYLLEKSEGMAFEAFISDETATRAFVRSLEIIGEAVKNISEEFKKEHPEIPWKEIAGTRDKLIHEYFGVNYKIVWESVKKDVPMLKRQIEELLK